MSRFLGAVAATVMILVVSVPVGWMLVRAAGYVPALPHKKLAILAAMMFGFMLLYSWWWIPPSEHRDVRYKLAGSAAGTLWLFGLLIATYYIIFLIEFGELIITMIAFGILLSALGLYIWPKEESKDEDDAA